MGEPGGIMNFEYFSSPVNTMRSKTGPRGYYEAPKPAVGGGGGGTIIEVTPTTTYIFRGFYLAGNAYEVWTGTSRNTPNPSGHPLINKTVTGELPYTNTY